MDPLPALLVNCQQFGQQAGNLAETGQVLHGYQSAWIPASLLQVDRQKNLADALFAAAQYWGVTLHTNKGLPEPLPK